MRQSNPSALTRPVRAVIPATMGQMRKLAASLMRRMPLSRARGIGAYWRDMERVRGADVALVSFPKSGRTFVRVMLARLYQQQFGIDERELLKYSTLEHAPQAVPKIVFTHDGDAMRPPSKIAIDRRPYRGRKVVVLARHPGDIIVSRYFHLRHRSLDRARRRLASRPLEEFIWTPHGGVSSIVQFLNGWARLAREQHNVHVLRYEDFLTDPERALAELTRIIGLASSEAALREAVEFARFENLRSKEREGYFASSRLGPGRAGDDNSFKVRSGKSGGFRSALSESGRARVEDYVAKQLDPLFGYSVQH